MKLRRLRIEQFKRFREPLLIENFDDGLNLFAAPNEAGKSTVAEAIRAAFFERHRSSSVEHLRPWGDASAAPSVEVEFDIDGSRYRLHKTFLGRKRCALEIAGQSTLDGVAAEDHLAGLLGFKFPGKGESKPEHMGIPGLLWIRQGGSHELGDVVSHAADQLRTVLSESLGELTATSGDALLAEVETARNELLTASTGKPRGELADAQKKQAELAESLAQLDRDIDSYQNTVDRLAMLRRDHQRDAQERPWESLRQQHSVAEAKLQQAMGLASREAEALNQQRQIATQVSALRDQLSAFARDDEAVKARTQSLEQTEAALQRAQTELGVQQQRHQHAIADEAAAREHLARIRAGAQHAELRAKADAIEATLRTQTDALQRARQAREGMLALRTDADALHIAPADLKTLAGLTASLRDLDVRLEAIATALDIELQPGQTLRIGDDTLSGSARRTVLGPTLIDIAGVGRITVTPGAADLNSLKAQREHPASDLQILLARLGVAHVAAAEERARQATQRRHEADGHQKVLETLAPQGIDTLDAERAAGSARLDALRRQLEALPPISDEDAKLPALASVEATAAHAATALKCAEAAFNEARIAHAQASSAIASARQELSAAEATLNDPQRAQKQTTAQDALTDALARQATAEQALTSVQEALQNAQPELLKQDVERLDRSARQLEEAHSQRQQELIRLEAELHSKGALGLEEQRAERQQKHEASRRRSEELGKRAAALDHLLKLLRDKRAALARRLRAPLQQHLDRNLQILFPGAHIEIADDLSPGPITRNGQRGTETGDFDQLSLGTREQMGIIARLAYADLLQQAGKPTLLILDDALVNTDDDRLAGMKRVLYDAAQRHQLLIFTCHPAGWRDLGVVTRGLES
ncbi:MAG: AAA family ATPase [Aquimonas sp.]|nr:AAA family ATPase [Aquimonas sp.]